MRLVWLGLALLTGCATGEDVSDQNVGGAIGSGGSAGAPQGGASGAGAAGAGGWPTGGGGGVAGAPGGTGGAGGTAAAGGAGTGGGGTGGSSAGGGTGCAVQGCQDGSSSGSGCVQARTIGRANAASAQGYVRTDTTCNATDQSTGYGSSCSDLGRDHTYRIFMRAGESFAATLTQGSKCSSTTSFNRVFKIYSGTSCSDTSCGVKTFCSPTGPGTYNKSLNVIQDGWYHLVVDGSSGPTGDDDSGSYTLTVKLACKTAGCEC